MRNFIDHSMRRNWFEIGLICVIALLVVFAVAHAAMAQTIPNPWGSEEARQAIVREAGTDPGGFVQKLEDTVLASQLSAAAKTAFFTKVYEGVLGKAGESDLPSAREKAEASIVVGGIEQRGHTVLSLQKGDVPGQWVLVVQEKPRAEDKPVE